jgi:hypothetical protein
VRAPLFLDFLHLLVETAALFFLSRMSQQTPELQPSYLDDTDVLTPLLVAFRDHSSDFRKKIFVTFPEICIMDELSVLSDLADQALVHAANQTKEEGSIEESAVFDEYDDTSSEVVLAEINPSFDLTLFGPDFESKLPTDSAERFAALDRVFYCLAFAEKNLGLTKDAAVTFMLRTISFSDRDISPLGLALEDDNGKAVVKRLVIQREWGFPV